MMRSTFSTTTIASSTTMPITSTMPNIVSTLIEKPSASSTRERAEQRDRHDDGRDQRVAQVLQEQVHHQEHQRSPPRPASRPPGAIEMLARSASCRTGCRTSRPAGSSATARPCACGPRRRWPAHCRSATAARRCRSRACRSGAPRWRSSGRRARCARRRAAARSSRRGWRAARCCRTARPMVSWPLTTTVAMIGWPGDVRQVADRARRDLRVLRADRGVDVVGRQVEADQLGRVDPDPHRALGAEQLRLADAGHALDLGQHVARRVVAERDRVVGRVVRRQDREQQEVRARLVDAHALLRHRRRQARRGARTAGSARRPAPGRGWCRARSSA